MQGDKLIAGADARKWEHLYLLPVTLESFIKLNGSTEGQEQ